MSKETLKLARQLLWRYRHETPIGNQPYMICHAADEAFEKIDEALAQRTEQNFCSRCGKRVGGIDSIHTCTPPMEKNT